MLFSACSFCVRATLVFEKLRRAHAGTATMPTAVL